MPFPDNSSLIRLLPNTIIKPFDCKDEDLNDFLHNDSQNYLSDLLAVTYLLESPDEVVGFYSLANDIIMKDDMGGWNRFRRRFKNNKRMQTYPAMKVGRLAISHKFQGQKIGKQLLDYLKLLFITNNRTGCRFITVDANNRSTGFYEKNGFLFMTEDDKNEDTRAMYFDLKPVSIFQQQQQRDT